MWEEHMYHFKSDWSQKKLKKHMKNRSQAQRRYALNRNYFLSAEDAHAFDPTYVVRESIYRYATVTGQSISHTVYHIQYMSKLKSFV